MLRWSPSTTLNMEPLPPLLLPPVFSPTDVHYLSSRKPARSILPFLKIFFHCPVQTMRAFLWTHTHTPPHTHTHTPHFSFLTTWVKKLLIQKKKKKKRSASKQDQKWGFLRCLNSAVFSLKTLLMDLVEAADSQWSHHSVRVVWSPGQG